MSSLFTVISLSNVQFTKEDINILKQLKYKINLNNEVCVNYECK